jgi:hypothetical protein
MKDKNILTFNAATLPLVHKKKQIPIPTRKETIFFFDNIFIWFSMWQIWK